MATKLQSVIPDGARSATIRYPGMPGPVSFRPGPRIGAATPLVRGDEGETWAAEASHMRFYRPGEEGPRSAMKRTARILAFIVLCMAAGIGLVLLFPGSKEGYGWSVLLP